MTLAPILPFPYAAERVEGLFRELRLYGVL
jgi:hypothetical protein